MFKRVTALLFFVLLTVSAIAQNLGGIDFENLKADDLSNEQIQTIYKRAQAEGYSIQELEALATARGMAPAEVSKLRQRLSAIRSKEGQQEAEGSIESTEDRLRQTQDDTKQATVSTVSVAATEKPIFGSELFTNKKLSFEPSQNIPTPENYQLGPGDEIIIDIWGAAENNYQLTVSPEGAIQIPNIGPIYVSGMNIDDATKVLIKRLASIYSGLTGPRKDTYAQISLGRVRTIKVNIVGEVKVPGTYSISSLSTVFNALYVSGGPSKNGTYRSIQVIRGDDIVETVDLYDFLVHGDQSSNIRLRDQDIIKIGPYLNRVSLNGQTKIQGLFETKEGETFEDLLEYSGGFNQQAYTKRIKITRNTAKERSIVEIHYPEEKSTVLESGDEISVGKILNRYANRVEIQGAVFREGEYQLEENPTLYTLIQHADGLMGDAYMERAIIYRTLPDYTVKNIPINLTDLIQNPQENDIELKKDDVVQISSIFDLREDYTVTISGEILSGGTFPFRENMTIKDLIYMANGFTTKAAEYNIEVARRIVDDGMGRIKNQIADIYNLELTDEMAFNNPATEFELKPFDQVFVRRSPSYVEQQSVTITGQVLYPGKYVIDSRDFTITDLVNKAGGITEFAYPEGASLNRQFTNLEQSPNQDAKNVIGLNQETLSQVGIRLDEILRNPNSDRNLLLVPGDKLNIPTKMQTVNIQGEVLFPINVRYDEGKSFKSYIRSAGGYSDKANRKKAYIVYANGEVDRTSRFLFFKSYPEVKPGSMIFIPKKEEETEISASERIAIYSTIVSMAAIVTNTIFQIRR
jgi:protein involved in polysaccharide export with SLBB domain